MYFRKKTSGGRAYLQIVESRREGAAVRQQVIATLGRVEDLKQSGQLERLLRSGARFSEKAIVLDAFDRGEATAISTRRIGPALAFERVWEETGCRAVIERLAGARSHDFPLERAAFLTVLHRLVCGGSDRAADRRREDYRIDGVGGIELHHLYRTMAWLGEELPKDQQDGATPFSPRCVKDVLEEELFACPARPPDHARHRVHGHDEPPDQVRGPRRADARAARLLQRPSARPQPDDPGCPARRRRPSGVHGDVAGEHRRCEEPHPGDRPPAAALSHQPGLRRRRPRHDQRRDDRRARSEKTPLCAGRARANRQARARPRARRSPAVHALRPVEAEGRGRLRGQGRDARRAALCRLPQPRSDEQGRRRPRDHRRQPGAAAEEGRQEPRRQQGLPPFPQEPGG